LSHPVIAPCNTVPKDAGQLLLRLLADRSTNHSDPASWHPCVVRRWLRQEQPAHAGLRHGSLHRQRASCSLGPRYPPPSFQCQTLCPLHLLRRSLLLRCIHRRYLSAARHCLLLLFQLPLQFLLRFFGPVRIRRRRERKPTERTPQPDLLVAEDCVCIRAHEYHVLFPHIHLSLSHASP